MIETISPSTKINNLVGTNPSPQISKTLRLFFIFYVYFFLGFNFGFLSSKHPIKNFFINIYCPVCGLAVSLYSAYGLTQSQLYGEVTYVWYCTYVAEYITFILVLQMTRKNNFNLFLKHLNIIDTQIGVDTASYKCDMKLMTSYVFSVVIKIILMYAYCSLFPRMCVSLDMSTLYFISLLYCDLPLIVCIFVFYSAYCRLRKLTEQVNKGMDMNFCNHIYKSLLDSTEEMKKCHDGLFIAALVYNIPRVMSSIYGVLLEMKTLDYNVLYYITEYISIIHPVVLMFGPALSAGMMSTQADKLRIILHDRLLLERDKEDLCNNIERFIRYIEARPCQFVVWKVIPLDATFPLIILNLCVTYLIVIVQFTHLY